MPTIILAIILVIVGVFVIIIRMKTAVKLPEMLRK
jgi:hypothetical protein